MKRLIVTLVAAFALSAAPAGAVTLVNPDGTPSRYQPVVVWSKMPTVRAVIEVDNDMSACAPAVLACAVLGHSIHLLALSIPVMASSLYHELGHEFDSTVMTNVDRVAFLSASGLAGPWAGRDDGGDRLNDGSQAPQDIFADTYADCAMYGAHGYAHAATSLWPRQYVAACGLITWVAEHRPGMTVPPPRRSAPAGLRAHPDKSSRQRCRCSTRRAHSTRPTRS